jgi:NAD(P)-dependent dehydrogenase (short-subunit alcohol dehydrogenase family)
VTTSTGRVALVTGADRGIGFAIATGLVGHGYRVILTPREPSAAEAAAGRLVAGAGEVTSMQLDVADPASLDRARQRVEHDPGRIDAGADYDEDQLPSGVDLELAHDALNVNAMG